MMGHNLTVGEYLVAAIKELGVRAVYGLPGEMVIKFFKVIEGDPDLDLYTLSHESGVGLAAIGAARATQQPAVACAVYGVGGLSMLNSVACAYAEKTPLIVISGGPGVKDREKGDFLFHTVKDFDSQFRIYKEVTEEAVLLDNPKTAYTKIQKALSTCLEFMRPVYIEIPMDIVDEDILIPEEKAKFSYPIDERAVKEAADEILLRVAEAKNPVILAGVETERFRVKDSILELSEKLNLPIVTDFLARDIIPEGHSNYFGTYVGHASSPVAMRLAEESDCLLMLGVIISDFNLGIKLKRLMQDNFILCISREVFIKHHIYRNVPLKNLLEEVLSRDIEKKNFLFPVKPKLVINKSCKLTDKLVNTKEIIDAINWFFSEYGEMPVISDTGDCLFTTLKIKTSMVMASAYYTTMGFAVPAAIGYALSTGRRPLVLLGDGAFQMTGQEMCHCPHYGLNPIFIVFNNGRWGTTQFYHPTASFTELVNWPYAEIAELWGGKGYVCDTCEKLYNALSEAKDNREFSLIEMVLEKEELTEGFREWVKEVRGQA
jgi:indolepyruvate decarboxylase